MTQNHSRRTAAALLLGWSMGALACHAEPRSTATQAPAPAAATATAPTTANEVTPMKDTRSNQSTGTAAGATTLTAQAATSIFETPVDTLDGKPSSLAAHRGKA